MGFRRSSCFLKCRHLFGIYHMLEQAHEHLNEELANSNQIVISYQQFVYHYDVHQRVRNGMPLKHSTSYLLAHTLNKPIGATPI